MDNKKVKRRQVIIPVVSEDYLNELIILCEKVLKHPISLDEFYDSCIEAWNENSLYLEILDNLETLLEHLPSANLFSNKVSLDKYVNILEYKILEIDIQILKSISLYDTSILKNSSD